mmetsp:Transcript_35274/g.44957  ORF Transcript_35274/g.44957 Transcript_35274/m.44957 type:complete len:743 (-) Transcript_35274:35-2263(-)
MNILFVLILTAFIFGTSSAFQQYFQQQYPRKATVQSISCSPARRPECRLALDLARGDEEEGSFIYSDGDEGFSPFEGLEGGDDVDYVMITEEELLEEWTKRGFQAEDFSIDKMLDILEEEDLQRQETAHFAMEGELDRLADLDGALNDQMPLPMKASANDEAEESTDDWSSFSEGLLEEYPLDDLDSESDEEEGEEGDDFIMNIEDLAIFEQGAVAYTLEDGDPSSLDILDAGDSFSEENHDMLQREQVRSVGIDLGTTNSAVAVIEGGNPVLIPNAKGDRTTPSVVAFSKDGKEVVVGENARRQQLANKENTFASVKRLMGLTFDEVKRRKEPLGALGVDKKASGLAQLKCPALKRNLKPQEISAEILNALVQDAESYLGGGTSIKRAVVTVPAYFTESQMEATREAAILSGLEKVKLMREPEAAALAYGLQKGEDELILVFDLGGGTFDCSVLEVGRGVIEVIATSGDSHLGGNDFDKCIANWMADEFVKQGNNDPRNDPFKMRRLLETAEQARIKLSAVKQCPVIVPFLDDSAGLDLTLSRIQMEHLCKIPLQRILKPVREVALIAGVSLDGDVTTVDFGSNEEEEIEVVGKNTNIKALKKQQQKGRKQARETKKEQKRKREQLAKAIQAAGQEKKVQFLPAGRPLKEVVMVGGATRMPCILKLVETVTGLKPRITVNPDEAVALGAAIQAGIIDGDIQGLEVMSSWQAAWLRSMALSSDLQDFEEEEHTELQNGRNIV